MKELLIVEGPTASGKSTLLDECAKLGFIILRGMPSQNPQENKSLVQAAQDELADADLNFRKMMNSFAQDGTDIYNRCVLATRIQFLEGLRLKDQGETVMLNRSGLSLVSLMHLAAELGRRRGDGYIENWATSMAKIAELRLIDRPIEGRKFADEVDGIILMTRPYTQSVVREREGMSGLEEREGEFIGSYTRQVSERYGIPLLELDANQMTIQEETAQVRAFILQ